MSNTLNTDKVVLFGSGRWARNIIGALDDILAAGSELTIFSRHGFADLNAWLLTQNFRISVVVKDGWPVSSGIEGRPVIIANGAHDHLAAGTISLTERSSVLIEKPMALNGRDARRLIDLANSTGSKLASAFVFLFAPYVTQFKDQLSSAPSPKSIHVRWADPKHTPKRYDSSVPVFKDVLPHIVSILNMLYPKLILAVRAVDVTRGGALVNLKLTADAVNIEILIERNGASRERLIDVCLKDETIQSLDFTNEPPKLYSGKIAHQLDLPGGHSERPLPSLLRAFLVWAHGGNKDPRLDPFVAADSCNLMDAIVPLYNNAQQRWLNKYKHFDDQDIYADVVYALTEIRP